MFISEDGTRNYKIVYWGSGLCGKTTSIQYIYDNTPENLRTQLVSLATEIDRVLFCSIKVENVFFHPYTVPGSVYYEESKRNILKGVDGIIFVADSQVERLEANVESFQNLKKSLNFYERNLEDIPFIVCFNKQDLPNILPFSKIVNELGLKKTFIFETVANKGIGVFEAFEKLKSFILEEKAS